MLRAHRIERTEELALDAQFLEYRLDHQIAGRQSADIGAVLQPRHHRVALGRGHLTALNRLTEERPALLHRLDQRSISRVVTDDVETGACRDDRDAGPHGATGAADADCLDRCAHFLTKLRPIS